MSAKGDFTADRRLILISAIALIIGRVPASGASGCCAVVAVVLLRLIGLFTNFFFYGRLSVAFLSPAGNHLGLGVVLVPVIGGLIIGLMARYGSERKTLLVAGAAGPHLESTDGCTVADLLVQPAIVAHEDETCRTVAERMADAEVGRLPVVARDDPDRVVGIVTRSDLLKARERYLELERQRERLLWQGKR
jgi:CBS domain-containing protein